jgi:hypothetical protein
VRGDCVSLSRRRGAQGKWHHAHGSDGDEDVANRVHDTDLNARFFFENNCEGVQFLRNVVLDEMVEVPNE